ncbi:hypothetical protein EYF80_023886 [Liparis tanakae]|uniref:Uncharacterized protein n=1 Tax=Liparis tanakae TaxID=230148 RepID=A0A4Z2HJF1_9TELE|nr:hypothetical protein EYF80_023886 [Liparis tanakae]
MSRGHLRIRFPRPMGARPRADGRRGRPMGEAVAGHAHLLPPPPPPPPPARSVLVRRPEEPKRF